MATTTSTTSGTSTSATASLVSSLGAGSGIDMAALATNLATAQFASKIDRLTTKSDTLTAQISSASNIKSLMLSFSTSLGDAVRTGSLSPQPQIAASGIATGTLTGSRTPTGTFSLEVSKLAAGQTLASAPYTAATSTVGAGTLKFNFGTVSGGTFAQDPDHAAMEITVASGATMSDVANAINAKKGGVTAYVAQTSAGAQLVFKGSEGAINGFQIEATEDSSDPGLSKLAWTADSTPSSTTGKLVASANDASLTIDGLAYTSSSNTVKEAIPGVSLKLTGINVGAPTTVSFSDTSASLTTTITDLTAALNEVMAAINTATDPASGDLRSDSGMRALKSAFGQLAGTVIMPNATGTAKTLSDLGIATQKDGTFKLDTDRLKATLDSDPDGVAAMFTTGLYGVYATVDKLYRNTTSTATAGSLGYSIQGMTAKLAEVKKDQTTISDKQETLRANLTARFAKTDSALSASQATLTFIQNQIAVWNNSDS